MERFVQLIYYCCACSHIRRRTEEQKLVKVRVFFDSWRGRVILFLAMSLSFYFLSPMVGIDNAFLILLPPFMLVTMITYLQMGINNIFSKRSILFSALVISSFFGIILLFSPNKISEWYTIIIRQGLREELYFRFCVLGVLKTSNEWSKQGAKRKALVLFANGLLFATLHIQYQTFSDYFTLLLLGFIFGYLFIEKGIVSAIVAHSLWNFYLNIIALIPLLILWGVDDFFIRRFFPESHSRNRR